MTTEVCCATRVWQPRHSRHVQYGFCTLDNSSSLDMTCAQALQSSTFAQRAGAWVLPLRNVTTVQGQPAGIWYVIVRLFLLEAASNSRSKCNCQLVDVLAPGSSRLCYCNQARIPSSAGPDISLLRPELQRQWHHAKNQHLGDRQITASSGLRVWWSCKQCPCGLLHEWLTAVGNRQDKDTQCPFCTNRSLCPHNSLSTVAPAVAAYWDTAKNGVTPDQIMAHSGARRHWLCPKCGHSWQANIVAKVKGRSKCPKCSNANRPYKKQPSLTQSQHPAMLEFDFERNRRAGLDPDKIMAGSAKMVHWIRTKCPRGRAHLFVASPHNRIGLNYGCPYCAGKKACICNSLQSLYPVLAAEYDTARNGDGPQQVLAGSAKMAFWKDATGHTWKQAVRQRTEPSQQRAKRAAIKSCNKLRGNSKLDRRYDTGGWCKHIYQH